MSEPRGIVYLFCGVKFAERMIVSLHSLRQHYSGPITVGVTDDDCHAVIREIEKKLEISTTRVEKAPIRRHSGYLTKTAIPDWSPYDRSLFIDGDTLIVGDPSPLFGMLDDRELIITNFGEWQSQGNRMAKRIRGWRGLTPAIDWLVEDQLAAEYPAINTGVFAWRRGWEYARDWAAVTQAGSPRHMADELAMQLLQSMMTESSYDVVGDRWNCSPLYGAEKDDAAIWHFHGNKHLRKEVGRKLWIPALEAAMAENVGGIADWAGKYDKTVRQHLAGEVPK